MKKSLLLTTILFLSLAFVKAQSLEGITEQEFNFASGSKEVQKLAFKDVNAKNLETAISTYFKKNYKAKVSAIKKTDKEFEVSEFKATDIQQRATSAIYKIQELDGNAILYIHYKSDGYVVSSKNTADVYPSYKSMSQKIANLAITYSYENVIKLRNKDLGGFEKELATMIKTENKNSDAIDKAKGEIKSSETTISTSESSLANQKVTVAAKAKLVEDQKTKMATVDVKSLEKNIKEVEGDTKKANKEIEKINADIAKKEAEIAKLKTEIETLKGSIQPTNDRIAANGEKIKVIETEISNFGEDALKEQLKLLEKDSKDAVTEEKKLVKTIEKEKASIEKNNGKIKDAEAVIVTSKKDQATKQVEVDKVKTTLKDLESKVSKLK